MLNRPYGGFPWIPLPEVAFDTYPNAHNGYGDFAHLEEATVEDADRLLRPVLRSIERGARRRRRLPPRRGSRISRLGTSAASRHARTPVRRSFAEPRLSKERRRIIRDPLIPQPAFAAGYRVPDPVSGS